MCNFFHGNLVPLLYTGDIHTTQFALRPSSCSQILMIHVPIHIFTDSSIQEMTSITLFPIFIMLVL